MAAAYHNVPGIDALMLAGADASALDNVRPRRSWWASGDWCACGCVYACAALAVGCRRGCHTRHCSAAGPHTPRPGGAEEWVKARRCSHSAGRGTFVHTVRLGVTVWSGTWVCVAARVAARGVCFTADCVRTLLCTETRHTTEQWWWSCCPHRRPLAHQRGCGVACEQSL